MVAKFTKNWLLAVFVCALFLCLIYYKVTSGSVDNGIDKSNSQLSSAKEGPQNLLNLTSSAAVPISPSSQPGSNNSNTSLNSTTTERVPVSLTTNSSTNNVKANTSLDSTKTEKHPITTPPTEKSSNTSAFVLGFTIIMIVALIAFTYRRTIQRLYKGNNRSHGYAEFRNNGREEGMSLITSASN